MELTDPLFYTALLISIAVYWALPMRFRSAFLLLLGYAFYCISDYKLFPVLLAATALDFFLAKMIFRAKSAPVKRLVVTLSVSVNLGILAFFKYKGLFLRNYHGDNQLLLLAAPLGVSFYTFHSISYVVDVYRGLIKPCEKIIEYAIYVAFFPKLVSGPIERSEKFLPQLRSAQERLGFPEIHSGIFLLIQGLFLKSAVSDRLRDYVGVVYDQYKTHAGLELLLASYAFSIKIYADFFGYTLIATGIALFFGIRLSRNFNSPYFAPNPQEFWRRWHITLSTWFRDYVYIPLGGNKRRRYLNVLITMALAGLWHGADAKFVFWGLFHGMILSGYLLLRPVLKGLGRLGKIAGVVLTFNLASIGWVYFRAESFSDANAILRKIAGLSGNWSDIRGGLLWVCLFSGMFALARLAARLEPRILLAPARWRYPALGFIVGVIFALQVFWGDPTGAPFTYFYF